MKCEYCHDDGFVIAENHVTREICPYCDIPPKRVSGDTDKEYGYAMVAYKVKMKQKQKLC